MRPSECNFDNFRADDSCAAMVSTKSASLNGFKAVANAQVMEGGSALAN